MNKQITGTCISIPSQKSGKPNEDFGLIDIDNDIYILCDGISRSVPDGAEYPIPSPSSIVAKLFGEAVHNFLINHILNSNNAINKLLEAVEYGNKIVNNWNKINFKKFDYLHNDRAGTVSIGGIIIENFFYYYHIGDCIGVISKDDGSQIIFGDEQTKMVRKFRKNYGFSDSVTIEIRKNFRNNQNSFYSYGAITGEETYVKFVECGYFSINNISQILLLSDGVEKDINKLIKANNILDLNEVIQDRIEIEKLNKLSGDDKTVIQIKIR